MGTSIKRLLWALILGAAVPSLVGAGELRGRLLDKRPDFEPWPDPDEHYKDQAPETDSREKLDAG